MTYTNEEQELIESIKTKVSFLSTRDKIIKDIFHSSAMQQIIESRIKQAKIELLEELIQTNQIFSDASCMTLGYRHLNDKLTELKK